MVLLVAVWVAWWLLRDELTVCELASVEERQTMQEKVVLVTGACSGIGYQMAKKVAEK